MGVQEDFELAAEAAKNLPENITNEEKLKLYGLYKQGTLGDVNTGDALWWLLGETVCKSIIHTFIAKLLPCADRPGIFDQKGRAKWDAWKGHQGASWVCGITCCVHRFEANVAFRVVLGQNVSCMQARLRKQLWQNTSSAPSHMLYVFTKLISGLRFNFHTCHAGS
jgi:diazepam-binding inhibitor (GABA receptor modulator, acyl-CoA-binding protein)